MNILSCLGLSCPQPVIVTKRHIVVHPDMQTFTVIIDNLPAVENVTRLLTSEGFTVHVDGQTPLWHLLATKKNTAPVSPQKELGQAGIKIEAQRVEKNYHSKKTVVIITSNVFGSGDDKLGSKLMKNFLLTLPEMGTELWRLILLNSGVQLSSFDSHVIEELKKIEQEVDILVCGTCLEHFNILDKKAVGNTTNMLDVVTSMQLADKVIHI